MAVRIKFDSSNNVIPPTFVLSNRSGNKLGILPAVDIQYSDNFNSYDELSFKVYKTDNGKVNPLWDKLKDFKLVWAKEYDTWFEINIELDDGNEVIKNVSAKSLGECELSQINLYGIQINTEDDISRDDYVPTVLFNEKNFEGSLLHRIMEKVPHYTIKHVDMSLKSIQRTFEFDGVSVYDAFQEIAKELNCIFVFNNGSNSDGKPAREINVYDLESYCLQCGNRFEASNKCSKCGSTDIVSGYGEDTTIFISKENLADSVVYSTDVDAVKNCFRLEAGDDLMTATIANCNPNGSNYIWYISDDVRADMSKELSEKIAQYDELYAYYQNEHIIVLDYDVVTQYNFLIEKYFQRNKDLQSISNSIVGYSELMTAYYGTIDTYLYLYHQMMPGITLDKSSAEKESAKIIVANLKNVAVADLKKASSATVDSTVLGVVKTIVDSAKYQVKINNSSYVDNVWSGNFVITNYSNDEDTFISNTISIPINDNQQLFVEQRLRKILSGDSTDEYSLTSLFALDLNSFVGEIRKYCLSRLVAFHDSCEACLNILIEQGIANNERYDGEEVDLYELLYVPYYNKYLYLDEEILIRQNEIDTIAGKYDKNGKLVSPGIQSIIEEEQIKIQDKLNFQEYLGDLWKEFVAYRREDTYSNTNYISDGLDNKELFLNALEFIEVAKKDIYKSATLQHTITASLKNLLTMMEFSPITQYFQVGNWIRIKIDGQVYALRIISYEIDYDSLDDISITFSDVKNARDGLSDVEDILSQASSMASSYGAIQRQANKSKKNNSMLDDWVNKGLALTKMKIIDNADNQNITWDEHGLLCKEYMPFTDDYDDKQLKIINRGLYLTDDNWKTSKAGIGDFVFYNPETGLMEEAYGVIADTLVGNLILTEKIGIYNVGSSVVIDENGLVITSDSDENMKVMTIQKKEYDSEGNESITPLLYIDNNGELVLTGSIKIQSGFNSDIDTLNDLCNPNKFTGVIQDIISTETQVMYSSIEEKYKTILEDTTRQLEQYKADIGQYMTFNDDGLTLGATSSNFKTVIDNQSMRFKQGDETVAYINNNQLYIENATIKQMLMLGNFFFNPRDDGGVSLTWRGGNE